MRKRTTRADGRGHWPAGKRRNPDKGNWSRIRLSLKRFLEAYWQYGVISVGALARELGISEKSVRRYLTGENRPDVPMQEAIEAWIAEKRAGRARRKGRPARP